MAVLQVYELDKHPTIDDFYRLRIRRVEKEMGPNPYIQSICGSKSTLDVIRAHYLSVVKENTK